MMVRWGRGNKVNLGQKHKRKGFTLIELMVVVGILSVLSSVAIPAFSAYIRKARQAEAMINLEDLVKLETVAILKQEPDGPGFPYTTVALVDIDAWHHPYKDIDDFDLAPLNWNRAGFTVPQAFKDLGFAPTGNLFYTYGIYQTLLWPGGRTYGVRIRAISDLDQDGRVGILYRNVKEEVGSRAIRADGIIYSGDE